jgi:MOSC domain-containing protein YiiM
LSVERGDSLKSVQSGVVESIFLTAAAGGQPQPVDEARAVAGKGLEGDRYFRTEGTFSGTREEGRDLTLIEAEAIEALARESGIELSPGAPRRNVVTRGLSLNDLVGKRFRLGDVECVGRMRCDPCRHLERLTEPGVLKGLVGRGGLRADILRGGRIAPGTAVSELSG